MSISENDIIRLRTEVKNTLSDDRYRHTIGVEKAAALISEKCLPDMLYEIRVAALLHDISKEYSVAEQIDMIENASVDHTDEDLLSPAVLHSLTAPILIKKNFPEYARGDVLSAVLNHTTGSADMSLFDEIIFVSDYVEEGRRYPECIAVREELFERFRAAKDTEECIFALHDATISALNNTIISVVKRGLFLHPKTVLTRNAFLGRRPIPLK